MFSSFQVECDSFSVIGWGLVEGHDRASLLWRGELGVLDLGGQVTHFPRPVLGALLELGGELSHSLDPVGLIQRVSHPRVFQVPSRQGPRLAPVGAAEGLFRGRGADARGGKRAGGAGLRQRGPEREEGPLGEAGPRGRPGAMSAAAPAPQQQLQLSAPRSLLLQLLPLPAVLRSQNA